MGNESKLKDELVKGGAPVAASFNEGRKMADNQRDLTKQIIRVVAIVVAVVLIANIFISANDHRIARDQCQKQVKTLNEAITKYSKQSSDLKKALSFTEDDVADPATINNLNKAVDDQKEALDDKYTCDVSGSTVKLSNQASAAQYHVEVIKQKSVAVDTAVAAVLKSHDQNNIADAKQAVLDKINEAKIVLNEAGIKVRRSKTYQALKSGVSKVEDKIKNSDISSVKVYTDLKNGLQTLIDNFKN